jgi:hypothetical protein
MIKILWFVVIFFSTILIGRSQQNNDCIVKIELVKREMNDSLLFKILVISNEIKTINVPQKNHLVVGYVGDTQADCYFEVVEINDTLTIHVTPTTDYEVFNRRKKDSLLHLKKDKSIAYFFNLREYYILDNMKKYKVRLIFKLSKYNSSKDVSSNWITI